MIFGIILIGLIVILVIYVIGAYNKLVKERNFVEEAFSTIDAYLKKRYDLIPNLVETVKGYKNYEGSTLEAVVAARTRYMSATSPAEKIENENMITGALGKLFALTESYPELKANENFMKLQNELVKIEEDILQARKYYNGSVRVYNTMCETFPSVIVANNFGFKKYPFFKVETEEERQNVKVQF
ncbi:MULTISPECIES: LemA family protein [Cetobacterium]|jgi:LemA protein|uniref:LemA family protein n=1 Tax=Candidatus Cetobacterium colombiensis TaxID=3073100 RepID=A0ABU4W8W8_9FUSO|nr:LemA family protein [Candidatus Cetobacterium colombiensis]MDX8335966.1 LemA family protein [Candidatus Cetobacterium colombiensis]